MARLVPYAVAAHIPTVLRPRARVSTHRELPPLLVSLRPSGPVVFFISVFFAPPLPLRHRAWEPRDFRDCHFADDRLKLSVSYYRRSLVTFPSGEENKKIKWMALGGRERERGGDRGATRARKFLSMNYVSRLRDPR